MHDPVHEACVDLEVAKQLLEPFVRTIAQSLTEFRTEAGFLRDAMRRTSEKHPKQFARQFKRWQRVSAAIEVLEATHRKAYKDLNACRFTLTRLRWGLDHLQDEISALEDALAVLRQHSPLEAIRMGDSLADVKALYRWRRNPVDHPRPFHIPEVPDEPKYAARTARGPRKARAR